MPLPWTRSGRQVQRMRQVAEVLLRHGLGYVATQIGLPNHLGVPASAAPSPDTLPARVRSVFEELGPTFVKLGQVLSTRADLLPPEWVTELARLQDNVAPFPFEQACAQVEIELHAPVDSLFRRLDPEPLAAASIGQVHRGELITGEQVVVKIQRPGVRAQMEDDLAVLREIARLAEGRTAWGRIYSFTALVDQFERDLCEQLDYMVEGRHAEHARELLSGDPELLVPVVFWTYTSTRVLTLEYIEGSRLSEIIAGPRSTEGRRRLAVLLVRAMLRQAFRDGVYHADPHPGNLLLAPDGRLVLMDFGLVGFLDNGLKAALAGLALGLVQRDAEEIALALQDLGVLTRPVPQRPLQRDIQTIVDQYYDVPLSEIPFSAMMQEVVGLAVKYGVQLSPQMGQFVRTLIILEGVAGQLEPELSLVELAGPVIEELRQETYSLDRITGDLRHSALLAARQLDHLPGRVRAFLQRLEGGQLPIVIEHGDFDRNLAQAGKLVNRVAAAILVAATLIMAGLLLGLRVGPSWAGLSWLGLLVFAAGAAGGAWLFMAIVRGGKL